MRYTDTGTIRKRTRMAMAWIIAAMLLAGLSACGSGKTEQAKAETAASSAVPAVSQAEEEASSAETAASETAVSEAAVSEASVSESAVSESPVPEKGEPASADLHHVKISVENYGDILLELDAGQAPITVENFMKLAREGFYDGLTFHRIMDGFMIQGGDPLGNGTGGSDEKIKGEFRSNGVENTISHTKGVISMARAMDPDSASSQFFITVADSQFLDGEYAAFGHVTEGQEVCDKIAADAKPVDGNGTIPPEEQPVITKIEVID